MAAGDLHLGLDFPLPEELDVGAGTAVFVCGWCFCSRSPIGSLVLVVDGTDQPLMAYAMPRRDVFEALHPSLDPLETAGMACDPDSPEDPDFRSFRSGFWGMAAVSPRERGRACELRLRARLDDGTEAVADLARIPTGDRRSGGVAPRQAQPAGGPLIAICMATHEPPMDLFKRQLDSIRAQTWQSWVCVLSDDCSSPESFAAMREALEGDQRFVCSRSPRRLGFYRNFERALSLTPAEAGYVALADQDDLWRADKLATLVGAIGDSKLAYSDARIVARDGRLISETYWSRRGHNHSNLESLLMANSVTGAASLLRREVIELALPFPPRQFAHFHDHWVALAALCLGDIAFVERPLYDYVQHRGAVLGHAAANRMPSLRQRLGGIRARGLRERVGLWRMTYFADACRLVQFATILRMRCGDRMSGTKRRSLDRFLRSDRSRLALGRLALRAARELVGPSRTLGAEVGLFFGFAWRHLLSASSRGLERPRARLRLDARPPTTLVPAPGGRGPASPAARAVADKIAPLELAVADGAPQRTNILIPTIDLDHFFGGYIAKLNLAGRLADRGMRVRIVTVDPVGTLPPSWARTLESYSGIAGLFDRVEVVFGRESHGVEVSRSDRFVATTWWTAHVARSALRSLGRTRFLYLIQEHEPFTFPMGTFAALASESYRLPHFALFSSELLRDYFRRRGIGVYADGAGPGDQASAAFENAITPVTPPPAAELARREMRRVLFYARPEPHASRNMFELGVLALTRAVEEGAFQGGWQLYGIGTVTARSRVELSGGVALELLPRRDQAGYARLLREHDVGLALMYTPHPSLVPIEMAAAGMLTVTNSFENKTAEAMSAISSNLITAEPTLDAVAGGLREAAAGVHDFERRARGSEVNWSRDWRRSFDDELMARVEGFLDA